MTDISLIQYARLLGANTVTGMAQKVGLAPPPPPISVRNMIDLAGRIILPFAPVDLQPPNNAQDVSNNPDLFFRDPAANTPAAAWVFRFVITQNNVVVGSPTLTNWETISNPVSPHLKYGFTLPQGRVTLNVYGTNKAGDGPIATSTFTVASAPPPPPPPQPTITASIGSDDKVTVNGQGFNKSQIVNLQATVAGGPSTPPIQPNNTQDVRNQFPLTTAHADGSFTALIILPQNFMPDTVQFQDGATAHVRAGETISVIAKNANVSNFTPGPGVSNVVTMTAPATV
jgi:hypothetical protein